MNPAVPSSFGFSRFRIALLAGLLLFHGSAADAAVILGGSMTVDLNESAFESLGLTGIAFFDQTANSFTRDQILSEPGASVSWTGLDFGINGASVDSPDERTLQPTTFTYDPLDLAGTAAGQIGLGGVALWNGGSFILGDYSLQYSADRAGGIYSGWYLTNTFDISAIAFDLANVTTETTPDGFVLSGDLAVADGSPLNLFFSFPASDAYGTFVLAASAVPEPAAGALFGCGAAIVLILRRRTHPHA